VATLARAPGPAVAFLQARWPPAPPVDPGRVAKLVAALNSDDPAAREQASDELEKLGQAAVPPLLQKFGDEPAAEARRRVELLVVKARGAAPAERLRTLRAVELLELIGTPEAHQLLKAWAGGAPGAYRTQEAGAALKRVAKRAAGKP
jgi:hypothetical protein